jgi:hypothetical protein
LTARVSSSVSKQAVPVTLDALDPFSEPEPSEGATIELASGRHVIVIYGLQTKRLSVHAAWPEAPSAVGDFLRESALQESAIEWLVPRLSTLFPGEPKRQL